MGILFSSFERGKRNSKKKSQRRERKSVALFAVADHSRHSQTPSPDDLKRPFIWWCFFTSEEASPHGLPINTLSSKSHLMMNLNLSFRWPKRSRNHPKLPAHDITHKSDKSFSCRTAKGKKTQQNLFSLNTDDILVITSNFLAISWRVQCNEKWVWFSPKI